MYTNKYDNLSLNSEMDKKINVSHSVRTFTTTLCFTQTRHTGKSKEKVRQRYQKAHGRKSRKIPRLMTVIYVCMHRTGASRMNEPRFEPFRRSGQRLCIHFIVGTRGCMCACLSACVKK